MNVPFKNITKIDTSKGVPVWVINMHDFRSFAEMHGAPDKTGVMQNLTDLNGLIELIKKNFLNGRDIGSTAILLSIACINFLSMFSPNATCSAFLHYVAFSKFGGVAYTGNSAKIVTVTRDDQVPAMLPFVLRDNDPIVAGYGVYLAKLDLLKEIDKSLANKTNTIEMIKLAIGIDVSKISAADVKPVIEKSLVGAIKGRHNTLYHDYVIDQNSPAGSSEALYMLFSMRKGAVLDLVDAKLPNVEICPHPILTIATHNNTLHSFAEIGFSLAFNVRATNSFGLAVTVATTGVQRKRGTGSLLCENTGSMNKVPKRAPLIPEVLFQSTNQVPATAHELLEKIAQMATTITNNIKDRHSSIDVRNMERLLKTFNERNTPLAEKTQSFIATSFVSIARELEELVNSYLEAEGMATNFDAPLRKENTALNDTMSEFPSSPDELSVDDKALLTKLIKVRSFITSIEHEIPSKIPVEAKTPAKKSTKKV